MDVIADYVPTVRCYGCGAWMTAYYTRRDMYPLTPLAPRWQHTWICVPCDRIRTDMRERDLELPPGMEVLRYEDYLAERGKGNE